MSKVFAFFVVGIAIFFSGITTAHADDHGVMVVIFDKSTMTHTYYKAERLSSEAKEFISGIQELNIAESDKKAEKAERLFKRFDASKIVSGLVKDGEKSFGEKLTAEEWTKALNSARANLRAGYFSNAVVDESKVEQNAALASLKTEKKGMSVLNIASTEKKETQITFLIFHKAAK